MSKVALGLCALLVAGGLCAAQQGTPLDPQAVMQEMSARMLALDSFHQAGQLSTSVTMGETSLQPVTLPLETWYEKPNKLYCRWANTLWVFDGIYGYYYESPSTIAYRFPAPTLPAGWEAWSSQLTTAGGGTGVQPGYYPPQIMQWLTQNATAYQSGAEIHVVFNLTGEQLMQLMSAMGQGIPGLPGLGGAEAGPEMAQALSQILAMMQMTWDVVVDANTFMTSSIRGQIGIPGLGSSGDFLLQFTVNEQNIPVPPEVFVFQVPQGVQIVDQMPPWMAPSLAPQSTEPPAEPAPEPGLIQ